MPACSRASAAGEMGQVAGVHAGRCRRWLFQGCWARAQRRGTGEGRCWRQSACPPPAHGRPPVAPQRAPAGPPLPRRASTCPGRRRPPPPPPPPPPHTHTSLSHSWVYGFRAEVMVKYGATDAKQGELGAEGGLGRRSGKADSVLRCRPGTLAPSFPAAARAAQMVRGFVGLPSCRPYFPPACASFPSSPWQQWWQATRWCCTAACRARRPAAPPAAACQKVRQGWVHAAVCQQPTLAAAQHTPARSCSSAAVASQNQRLTCAPPPGPPPPLLIDCL